MYGVHIRNLALSIVAVQHVKHVKNNNVFLPYQMFNFQQQKNRVLTIQKNTNYMQLFFKRCQIKFFQKHFLYVASDIL